MLKGPGVIGGWEQGGGVGLGVRQQHRMAIPGKVLQFMNAIWRPPLVFLVIYKRYDIHGLPKFSI